MAIEHVIFIGTLTAHFGIKVQTASGKPASFEDLVHHQRVLFNAVRELVGIPAELRIAAVGIHGTEDIQGNRTGNFMLEGMPCKGRVVGFDVDFNLFFQTKLLQESIYRGDIVVVLMLSRLLRFRFDKQRATETDFMFVFNDHLQETTNLLALLPHIRIQERFVTFTAAPQNIVFPAQFLGRIHGGNDLGCSPGEHFRIRVGCRSGTVTWVGKAVGCPPQQFHPGFLLFLRQHIGHYGKVIQIFLQRCAFW